MMNRTIAPQFKQISDVLLPDICKRQLSNGIPVYFMESENDDVVRFDIVFKAGNWYQKKPLVSAMTNGLMREGTKNMTSKQIADKIDFYGSHLQPYCEKDNAGFVLYTLKKHLDKTLEILSEVVKNPLLSKSELEILRLKSKQSFNVEIEKIAVASRKLFFESIFGSKNPYGYNLKTSDYNNFTIDDIYDMYNSQYAYSNCYILCSCKDIEGDLKIIDGYFGDKFGGGEPYCDNFLFQQADSQLIISEKVNALQSSIRVGCPSIDKYHPDYSKLKIANTLLGGYFGSRLMKNIREEKGYTYGISSSLYSLHRSGFFMVSTEVGADVTNETIAEIYKEIDLLQTKFVSDDELFLVKNYMLGEMVRYFDSIFNQFEMVKAVVDFNLGMDFYKKRISDIKSITPEEILNLSQQYFNKRNLKTVIVGKK